MDDPGGGGGDPCPSGAWRAESRDMAIPGPVFFLIREQAKSLLAIKELQDRVQYLEGSRNDIFFAIRDIQQGMHHPVVKPSQVSHGTSTSKSSNNSVDTSCTKHPLPDKSVSRSSWTLSQKAQRHTIASTNRARTKSSVVITKQNSPTKRPASLCPQVTAVKGDTSTNLESDKQDSGLDSDCRDHGIGALSNSIAPKDELLFLLDMISERGLQLREKVEEMEKAQESPSKDTGFPRNHSCPSQHSMLEFHSKELQARFSEMEMERTAYRTTVQQLRSVIHRLEGEKTACEERLQSAIYEKQQLEKKIHDLHLQYVRGEPSSLPLSKGECWTSEHSTDLPSLQGKTSSGSSKGVRSDEGKARVSTILRENDPLELQKLLLLYTLENQSLQQKIEEREQKWFGKLRDWKTTEASLRADIQNLIQERDVCEESLRKHQDEVRALSAKYRVLEMTLMTISSRDCGDSTCEKECPPRAPAWLYASQRLARSYHSDADNYGEPYYRAQSMPPVLLTQAENRHMLKQNLTALHCAGSSLVENSLEDAAFPNEGMAYDLEDPGHQRPLNFISSPLSSPQKLFRPLWQNPATVRKLSREAIHLMNLEDSDKDLNSGPKSDIELICNEFDPLVKVDKCDLGDKGTSSKPLDFVDSLDLSVPLNPTKVPSSDAEDDAACGGLQSRYIAQSAAVFPVETVQPSRTFSQSST